MTPQPQPFAVLGLLFFYAILSNVAIAVVPHEPVVIWYGVRFGVIATALVATAGTAAAAWVDHRVFARFIARLAARHPARTRPYARVRRWFSKAPFAVLALSGITPLPFFPFKVLAFAERYPRWRYVAAIATGRMPRYVLLAWAGYALSFPTWVLILLFVLMLLPSLRMVLWKPANAN